MGVGFIESFAGPVRVVSPTGGEKEVKREQFHHLYMPALLAVGRIGEMGARKYAAYNYRLGIPYSQLFDAAMRHLMYWWEGQDNDPESGESHLAHAAWNVLALAAQMDHAAASSPGNSGAQLDDRPSAFGLGFFNSEETS